MLEVLGFAEAVGALAVSGIAELANDAEMAERVLNKVKERAAA
jgi:hypothetical protein